MEQKRLCEEPLLHSEVLLGRHHSPPTASAPQHQQPTRWAQTYMQRTRWPAGRSDRHSRPCSYAGQQGRGLRPSECLQGQRHSTSATVVPLHQGAQDEQHHLLWVQLKTYTPPTKTLAQDFCTPATYMKHWQSQKAGKGWLAILRALEISLKLRAVCIDDELNQEQRMYLRRKQQTTTKHYLGEKIW